MAGHRAGHQHLPRNLFNLDQPEPAAPAAFGGQRLKPFGHRMAAAKLGQLAGRKPSSITCAVGATGRISASGDR
jgi:hypothetical protein